MQRVDQLDERRSIRLFADLLTGLPEVATNGRVVVIVEGTRIDHNGQDDFPERARSGVARTLAHLNALGRLDEPLIWSAMISTELKGGCDSIWDIG